MTDTAASAGTASWLTPAVFTVAVFSSAALVFLIEPMIAQMLLPWLGGSPAVWNTSLAFFQIALLAGYAHAHVLQRVHQVRRQMALHLGLLVLAAMVLPLHLSFAGRLDSSGHPILWLLTVLALSIGAPFAVLSATAPLLQVWFARTTAGAHARNPYVLYAASNLGSLLALLAYPFVLQPLLGLKAQALDWSLGYVLFVALIAALAMLTWKSAGSDTPLALAVRDRRPSADLAVWRERVTWMLLAAAPSSLVLGVTTHITTDVASAPFLWAPPLALYLLTFVIAFQDRPPIHPKLVLVAQAIAGALCLALLPIKTSNWLPLLGVHLFSVFTTALVCHQTLAHRRPPAGRLTEFYLLMSLGGVIGGAFNAFLAPVIFNGVWEYPLVLVLAGFARPWGEGAFGWRNWLILFVGVASAMIAVYPHHEPSREVQIGLFGVTVAAGFLIRDRAPAFVLLMGVLALCSQAAQSRYDIAESRRSFFGVIQLGQSEVPGLGTVRFMVHGTTLHGAQAEDPALACTPMTYYAPRVPIGQVLRYEQSIKPAIALGAIGLGTGSVAAYVRPSDAIQFFEIDPLVIRIASDPKHFSYLHGCAKGGVKVTLGDARLSLLRVHDKTFDVLLVDAFSSDSVPTHLMTVDAMSSYLRVLKPDGLVIMHLSNRNLELAGPAAAVVRAAGGSALIQSYRPPAGTPLFQEASSIVLIAARTPGPLEPFRRDLRWVRPDTHLPRPWTDDYSNVLGALIERLKHPRQ